MRSQIEDDINELSSAYVQHEPRDLLFTEPSRTRQEFADECDINKLMARFEATGVITHVNQRQPMYLDLSEPLDLQRSLEIVQAATEAFNSLPARVRAEFDNDPVRFVSFAEDPANLDQLREWGLAPPAVTPKVDPVGEPNPSPPSSP